MFNCSSYSDELPSDQLSLTKEDIGMAAHDLLVFLNGHTVDFRVDVDQLCSGLCFCNRIIKE